MRNILDRKRNVISEELRIALETEGASLGKPKYKNKELQEFGLYLFTFRLFNKKSNVYIYSYHYYHPLLVIPFLSFLECRNYNKIRFTEWGDCFIIVNEDVFLNLGVYEGSDFDAYIASQKPGRFFLNNEEEFVSNLHALKYINNVNNPSQFLLEMINKFNYVTKHESREMIKLWELAVNKDYYGYINHLIGKLPNFNLEDALNKENLDTNLLHGCIYVTQDGKGLIRTLNELGYNVNRGPKEWCAEDNTGRNLLNQVDGDFRESLFRHHIYHSKKSFLGTERMLSKTNFNHRNINCNLGTIKWYSTSTSLRSPGGTTKLDSTKLKYSGPSPEFSGGGPSLHITLRFHIEVEASLNPHST